MSALADWFNTNAANILLIPHILLILYGAVLFSPLGTKIARLTKNVLKGNLNKQERMINGLLFTILGGFTVSSHTFWIHQRIASQGSSFCSGSGLFSCGDVIGHETYGYAPIIGVPWGLIGMGVFFVLLYLGLVLKKSQCPYLNQVLERRLQNPMLGPNLNLSQWLVCSSREEEFQ